MSAEYQIYVACLAAYNNSKFHEVALVISPLLANLFLHHGMDEWLSNHFPEIPFARYTDDTVLHCRIKSQAQKVIAGLAQRLKTIGLTCGLTATEYLSTQWGKNQVVDLEGHRHLNQLRK